MIQLMQKEINTNLNSAIQHIKVMQWNKKWNTVDSLQRTLDVCAFYLMCAILKQDFSVCPLVDVDKISVNKKYYHLHYLCSKYP